MASQFPALRGKMGEMEYALVMMRLGEVVRHIGYAETIQEWGGGIPSEFKMKTHPELSRESISVILVPGKGYRKSQQIFTDLNRYAKQPSKTLNLLFEHREFFAVVAKEVGSSARTFRDRVNLETNSLGQKARHHITLGVLYECVLALLDGHYNDSEKTAAKIKEATNLVTH